MLEAFLTWWPATLMVVSSGAINLIGASYDLADKCKRLVYFSPFSFFFIYVWGAAEFGFPALVCVKLLHISSETKFDTSMLAEAIVTGLTFTAILNSKTELGSFAVNLKNIHGAVTNLVYARIANKESARTARFWKKFADEFRTLPAKDIAAGFDFLLHYVANDVSLNEEKRKADLSILTSTQKQTLEEQVDSVSGWFSVVRRRDIPQVLTSFGMSSQLVNSAINPEVSASRSSQ